MQSNDLNIELPSILINKGSKGGYYLYSYKNKWDPVKKRSKRVDSHVIGKILSDNKIGEVLWKEEFLEQYPILKQFRTFRDEKSFRFEALDLRVENQNSKGISIDNNTFIKNYGSSFALNEIVLASNFMQALKSAFLSNDDYLKILSLCYFIILNKDSSLSFFEEFSEINSLPYTKPLSDREIFYFFKDIKDEQIIKFIGNLSYDYISNKNANKENILLAFDSSSYLDYLNLKNSNKDYLHSLKNIVLIDKESYKTIFYKNYKDEILSLDKIFLDLKNEACINSNDKIILVSQINKVYKNALKDSLSQDLSFIYTIDLDNLDNFFKQHIDNVYERLQDPLSYQKSIQKNVVTISLDKDEFSIDNTMFYNKKLYIHIYLDKEVQDNENYLLLESIKILIEKLQKDENINIEFEQKLKDLFVIEDKNDIFRFRFNKENLDLHNKYKGISIIVSDCIDNAIDCYLYTLDRDYLEASFKNLKDRFDLNVSHLNKELFLNIKVLIQMLSFMIFIMTDHKLIKYAKKFDNLLLNNSKKDTLKILKSLNNILVKQVDNKKIYYNLDTQKNEYLKMLNLTFK